MKIKFSFFLSLFFLLFSSSENKKTIKFNEKYIVLLQKDFLRVLKTAKDSTSYYIEKQNKIISNEFADSLRQENFYENGVYQYKIVKNVDSAFYYFEKAISLSKNILTNKRELNYFYNLAKYYNEQKKTEDALYTLNRFKRILDKKKDLRALGYIYNLKAQIFESIGVIDSVYFINNKVITVFKILEDKKNLIISYINKSNYLNYLNKTEEAIKLLDSLNKSKVKNRYLRYLINKGYGDFNFDRKKYKKASNLYLEALKNIKNSNKKNTTPYKIKILNKYYASLLNSNKIDFFPNYLDSVKETSISTFNYKEFLKNKIHYSYLKNKEFNVIEKDLDSFYLFLLNEDKKRKNVKFSALEKAYKKEKELLLKKQKIELKNKDLKQKQLILFGLLMVSLLSFLVLIFWSQKRKLKQKKNSLLMQQRLFRLQMNPHFTSNVLSALQNLLKKDIDKTALYLEKFSRLLRIIFNNSTKDYVILEDELEALVKYMQLQQLRFQDFFVFKIHIDDKIEIDSFKIPPMLIQPFVENAIRHGFNKTEGKGRIEIDLSIFNENYLHCEIKDNGIGINELDDKELGSTKLLKRLIYKLTGEIVILKSEKCNGVTVSFKIPYIFEL